MLRLTFSKKYSIKSAIYLKKVQLLIIMSMNNY